MSPIGTIDFSYHSTTACFEPSLDYIVVKITVGISPSLPKFEEALQIRMVNESCLGFDPKFLQLRKEFKLFYDLCLDARFYS
uniref:Uncharacterized protein n=1 Tax=Amphimedon queenslandica TaxID=400682 RepID=A0A1X7USV5_AMPQE